MAEQRLEEMRELRLAKRQALLDAGETAYPSVKQLTQSNEQEYLTGRLTGVRAHGGVVFLDLFTRSETVQLQASKNEVSDAVWSRVKELDTGDFVEAIGKLGKTQRGVETLFISDIALLVKSVRPIPSAKSGFKDTEQRYRQREVDLALNEDVRTVFETRSKIIAWLRNYLASEGYLEVETPILQELAGGAAARPFSTHHNALDMPLYLRISAELYLKRLLVSGFDKVFEIERRFRNEGVDRQHNPEFTMLESQWAYADYNDLMDFTEQTIEKLVNELHGGTTVEWQGIELNFATPWKRVSYIELVSEKLGVDILEEQDPSVYVKLFEKHNLELPEAKNYYQLVDELYKELVRPTLQQPTLLYDYPVDMAPLAKPKESDPRIVEKFQWLCVGLELNTCYTEQNDPVALREVLEKQLAQHRAGDDEAHQIDEAYMRALEYGIPPNAGWSLGIDRFTMLMTNSASIRDTILFPLLKPKNDA